MRYLVLIFVIYLSGCLGVGGHGRSYKYFIVNEEPVKYTFKDLHIDDITSKLKNIPHINDKVCIYALSYFLILNFWDITFSTNQDIKKTMRNLKLKEYNGLADISMRTYGFASPLFSYGCTITSGIPIKSKEDFEDLLKQ